MYSSAPTILAGHSSIVITMRYVHPQADAIERVFAMAYGKIKPKRLRGQTRVKEAGVGTRVAHSKNQPKR